MINVAVMGFGTVGSGVVELMAKNHDKIAASAAAEISVKYILDVRDFPDSPFADLVIHDFSVIENDPDVSIVVETIGGTGVALDFTRRALLAGKNVVTSNKELVAAHGHELLAIARERNLNYLFEASVGGGIPILRPISQCLAANEIEEIYGILNGTTNYILTRMYEGGAKFEDALKEAQAKGYAEANPAADIEGRDTCRKICILSDLAFGRQIDPEQVPTRGITEVDAKDVAILAPVRAVIKLIGRAVRTGKDSAAICVEPFVVMPTNQLNTVRDVFNGIVVRGNATGDTMFYGRGAGKMPTASAVVADVIDAAKHFRARKYVDWGDGGEDAVTPHELLESRWYVRGGAEVSGAMKLADGAYITDGKYDAAGIEALAGPGAVKYRVLD
jgi:homoserine dehydrogenase